MIFRLTDEQQQALANNGEEPLRLVDVKTDTTYVLLPADVYDRLKALFQEDPVTREEQLYFLREAGKRAGWNDPAMDVYNDLGPRKVP